MSATPESDELYFTPLHHKIAEQLGYKQTPGYASWDKVEKTAPVQVIDRLANFYASHIEAEVLRVRIDELETCRRLYTEATYVSSVLKDLNRRIADLEHKLEGK